MAVVFFNKIFMKMGRIKEEISFYNDELNLINDKLKNKTKKSYPK